MPFSKGLKEERKRTLAELSQSSPFSITASWNKTKDVARTECDHSKYLSTAGVYEQTAKRLTQWHTSPMLEASGSTAVAATVEEEKVRRWEAGRALASIEKRRVTQLSLQAPTVLVMEVVQHHFSREVQVVQILPREKCEPPLIQGEDKRQMLHLNYLLTELRSMTAHSNTTARDRYLHFSSTCTLDR